MTACEYAICRYARMLMTPAELEYAQTLAKAADRGAHRARAKFHALVSEILWDKNRRPSIFHPNNVK